MVEERERGFALLLVLWALSLLTLLGAQVTGAGRAEIRLSSALVAQAQLQEAADAAVYETIWQFIAAGDSSPPDPAKFRLREGAIDVDVTRLDDRGKMDLNAVSGDLAASFFATLGLDRDAAQNLADRITEWRTGHLPQDESGATHQLPPVIAPPQWGPPSHDFERLDELLLVPGMTDALYRNILPHAVLHLGQSPLYSAADPVVRATLDQHKRETGVSQADPDPREGYVVHIFAHASRPGATFTRQAELRMTGSLGNDRSRFRVLTWESGEALVP